jgi:hypothetical protein
MFVVLMKEAGIENAAQHLCQAFWKGMIVFALHFWMGDFNLTQDWVVDNFSVTYFRSQL